MKAIKTISGILGLLALIIVLYAWLNSPAYINSMFAITASAALIAGSILAFLNGRIASVIGGILLICGGFAWLSYVGVVDAAQRASGVLRLPDYIPDGLEMFGFIIPMIAGILSLVSAIGKHE